MYQWYNCCAARVPPGKTPLRINVDETSVCLFQGQGKGTVVFNKRKNGSMADAATAAMAGAAAAAAGMVHGDVAVLPGGTAGPGLGWDRETERQRDSEPERQRDKETERERQTDRQTDRQAHVHCTFLAVCLSLALFMRGHGFFGRTKYMHPSEARRWR